MFSISVNFRKNDNEQYDVQFLGFFRVDLKSPIYNFFEDKNGYIRPFLKKNIVNIKSVPAYGDVRLMVDGVEERFRGTKREDMSDAISTVYQDENGILKKYRTEAVSVEEVQYDETIKEGGVA